MTFIQFYYRDRNGDLVECMGSDQVHPVDGRLSIPNAIMVGARRARQLRKVKRIDGMKVMRGERFSSARALTGMIPINDQNIAAA